MKNITPILSFIILFFSSSCTKKYEEGSNCSFIKPENRIIGCWGISQVSENENTITDAYSDLGYNSYRYTFSRNLNNEKFIIVENSSNNKVVAQCRYYLNDDVTNITFALISINEFEDQNKPLFNLIPSLKDTCEWKIICLKKKEMVLTTQDNNIDYLLRFKLIYDFDINN